MSNYFFIYPKDKKGKKSGHSICIMLDKDKDGQPRVYYGISLCSLQDQFTYETGRKLALDRATEAKNKKLT